MASNKDRSLVTRKQAIGGRPWPNLPQSLLNSIAKNPHLLQQISYPAGTIKSWASPARRCSYGKHPRRPQLIELEGCKWNYLIKTLPHFINIFFKTEAYPEWYHGGNMPGNFWHGLTHFVGYSRGSLIHRGPNDPSCFEIYDISTRLCSTLLPWDVSIPFRSAAVNYLPDSPILMAVVTGISRPAIVAYSYCQDLSPWIKIDSTEIDPWDDMKQFMKFTNIIGFQGKFYALTLQGALAVFEETDSGFAITAIGINRAVPSVPSKYFKEYLFELNGEILLAFLIYQRTSAVVDKVEVFRLDNARLSWIKLETLQEKALFLESECCIWVESNQVGCRGNCVYFNTQCAGNEWYMYDMEIGCISPGLAAASLPWNQPS